MGPGVRRDDSVRDDIPHFFFPNSISIRVIR